MSRNIILFAPRTGSSYLAALIAKTTNTRFYSEGWVLSSTDKPIQLLFVGAVNSYHNPGNADLGKINKFYDEVLRRTDYFTNTDNWTIKMHNYYASGISRKFIEHHIEIGSNIFLPHRKDITRQFLSFLNAAYRQHKLNQFPEGFIFTTNSKVVQYDEITWPAERIGHLLDRFILELMLWRSVYESYKNRIKIVSYENDIITNDFSKFGITAEQVQEYFQSKDHLIPTPNNVPIYKDNIWNDCVRTLNKHQHLVDI